MTEILYALGVSDRIVAVDTTSLFPVDALKQKPNVGYMRALSAEGVLGLKPSLVLAIEGSGPTETVAVLKRRACRSCASRIAITADGIVEKIRMVAQRRRTRRSAANASRARSASAISKRLPALRAKIDAAEKGACSCSPS